MFLSLHYSLQTVCMHKHCIHERKQIDNDKIGLEKWSKSEGDTLTNGKYFNKDNPLF